MDKHKAKVRRNASKKIKYLCSFCGKCFCAHHSVKDHEKSHTGQKPEQCCHCGKCFATASSRRQHEKIHGQREAEKNFLCSFCGKTFPYKRNKLRHEKLQHGGEKSFKCTSCNRSFGSSWNLKVHAKTHQKDCQSSDYPCPDCGKKFSRLNFMVLHRKAHARIQSPQVCSYCGKSFKKLSVLKIHMRTHTGERPHICTICGERFTTSGTLNRHTRRRHGRPRKRLHSCEHCQACFATRKQLKLHLKTHTDKKVRFECSVCGRKYMSAFALKRHEVLHSVVGRRQFACDICGKSYSYATSLAEHKKLKHLPDGTVDTACKLCEKKFSSVSSLRRHETTCHGVAGSREKLECPFRDRFPCATSLARRAKIHRKAESGKQYTTARSLEWHHLSQHSSTTIDKKITFLLTATNKEVHGRPQEDEQAEKESIEEYAPCGNMPEALIDSRPECDGILRSVPVPDLNDAPVSALVERVSHSNNYRDISMVGIMTDGTLAETACEENYTANNCQVTSSLAKTGIEDDMVNENQDHESLADAAAAHFDNVGNESRFPPALAKQRSSASPATEVLQAGTTSEQVRDFVMSDILAMSPTKEAADMDVKAFVMDRTECKGSSNMDVNPAAENALPDLVNRETGSLCMMSEEIAPVNSVCMEPSYLDLNSYLSAPVNYIWGKPVSLFMRSTRKNMPSDFVYEETDVYDMSTTPARLPFTDQERHLEMPQTLDSFPMDSVHRSTGSPQDGVAALDKAQLSISCNAESIQGATPFQYPSLKLTNHETGGVESCPPSSLVFEGTEDGLPPQVANTTVHSALVTVCKSMMPQVNSDALTQSSLSEPVIFLCDSAVPKVNLGADNAGVEYSIITRPASPADNAGVQYSTRPASPVPDRVKVMKNQLTAECKDLCTSLPFVKSSLGGTDHTYAKVPAVNKVLESLSVFEAASKTSAGKRYACSHCHKSYERPFQLKVHLRDHTGQKPYTCSFCDKQFAQKFLCKVHERTHTGERPYSCLYCKKTFTQCSTRAHHEKVIHLGDNTRQHHCTECEKSFRRSNHLKVHMRIHTGMKPYECLRCGQSFRHRSGLKQHTAHHTGEL